MNYGRFFPPENRGKAALEGAVKMRRAVTVVVIIIIDCVSLQTPRMVWVYFSGRVWVDGNAYSVHDVKPRRRVHE